MNFKKGDIIWGKYGTPAVHPIVFYANIDDDNFEGFMLTRSSFGDNLPFSEDFIKKEVIGILKPFRYNNTHIVNTCLLKKWEWKPFRKKGELTSEGIAFIEAMKENKISEFWEVYRLRSNTP